MKLNTSNLKLYPLTFVQPKYYKAIGHIDLYDKTGKIVSAAFCEIPKCYYDEITDELIVVADEEGVD